MRKLLPALVLVFVAPAFAQEYASKITDVSWVAMAKGLCMALAVMGAAYGQGKAASTALDGIARNPSAAGKIQTPLIISLALLEALAILAFVIANGMSVSSITG